jgi:hypothetical protein
MTKAEKKKLTRVLKETTIVEHLSDKLLDDPFLTKHLSVFASLLEKVAALDDYFRNASFMIDRWRDGEKYNDAVELLKQRKKLEQNDKSRKEKTRCL